MVDCDLQLYVICMLEVGVVIKIYLLNFMVYLFMC